MDPRQRPIQGKDISLWNDDNSTPQMFDFDTAVDRGIRFFGIKISQSNYLDPDFLMNWHNCKLRRFKRMGYHFLSWDTPIREQADTFVSALKNDPGEIYPVADYEMVTGINNISNPCDKLWEFIVRVEDKLNREVMIYTSNGYWKSYGSKDHKFNKKLWIAYYNYNVSEPPLPEPFDQWLFWQYGLGKGTGIYYGAESLDLDEDTFNGDDTLFKQFFGEELPQKFQPQPPAEEGTYEVIANILNIRSGPGINYPIIGKLSKGNLVKPLDFQGKDIWIKTDKGYVCMSYNGNRYLRKLE